MVGGESKRIAEPLELLRVRLITGYMGHLLKLPHSSFCHATNDGFHLLQKEKVQFYIFFSDKGFYRKMFSL